MDDRPRLAIARLFFFFNATATTEIYTLSLHDALPIWARGVAAKAKFTTVLKQGAALWGDMEAAIPGNVEAQITGGDQLAQDRAPGVLVFATVPAIGGQAAVTEAADFFRIGAQQHVDDMDGEIGRAHV